MRYFLPNTIFWVFCAPFLQNLVASMNEKSEQTEKRNLPFSNIWNPANIKSRVMNNLANGYPFAHFLPIHGGGDVEQEVKCGIRFTVNHRSKRSINITTVTNLTDWDKKTYTFTIATQEPSFNFTSSLSAFFENQTNSDLFSLIDMLYDRLNAFKIISPTLMINPFAFEIMKQSHRVPINIKSQGKFNEYNNKLHWKFFDNIERNLFRIKLLNVTRKNATNLEQPAIVYILIENVGLFDHFLAWLIKLSYQLRLNMQISRNSGLKRKNFSKINNNVKLKFFEQSPTAQTKSQIQLNSKQKKTKQVILYNTEKSTKIVKVQQGLLQDVDKLIYRLKRAVKKNSLDATVTTKNVEKWQINLDETTDTPTNDDSTSVDGNFDKLIDDTDETGQIGNATMLKKDELKSGRIIGGNVADPEEFPWLVSLQTEGKGHFCGGTIIHRYWIITAAHCVTEPNTNQVLTNQVRVGHGSSHWFMVKLRKAVRLIPHPNYQNEKFLNDIALIKVDVPFKFGPATDYSTSVVPVCLHDRSLSLPKKVTVAGWGALNDGSPSASTSLMYVDVGMLPDLNCKRAYDDYDNNMMLCAGVTEGGRDACQGDSGGPLHASINDQVFQIGVVSYGDGCGRAGYPGVYTRISSYRDWIRQTTDGQVQ